MGGAFRGPLTVAEAASILGCSKRYVQQLAKAGRLGAVRTVSSEEAAAWLIRPGSLILDRKRVNARAKVAQANAATRQGGGE